MLLQRESRFRAMVKVGKRLVAVHVSNSGRLSEVFVPGRLALLRPLVSPQRTTRFDLLLVHGENGWVSIDARLPPLLLEEAMQERKLNQFQNYSHIQREPGYGLGRLDLRLWEEGRPDFLVEAKSVTLVRDGVAYFPDALTARGRRHLGQLARAVGEGKRAAMVFVVQREDAEALSPHHESDPLFGPAALQAASKGVEIYAYRCRVNPQEIRIAEEIPVRL
ncbi:MAG: DNA/RNA nuclease SfsA [Chloroflexi bacterium]|nr:DNA/RNA nuclease SfsA [Chloroflexota bacterium]